MRYEQSFLENLKQQTDIVRLVQDYVPLKKKGNNYWTNCPFHGEKTASFSVNPKGFYYCFGCQKKGSAFNFVMEMENVGFAEAVRIVADKQGVKLPAPVAVSKADEEKYQAQARAAELRKREAVGVVQLNTWALEFWENNLQENNPDAKAAREYLEKRGVSDETGKNFRLGFAPDKWDALLSFLKSKGAADEAIEKSGLVSKNEEKNRVYDRFRGRVMFPVLDAAGKPIAFGARILDAGEPKYLNSPETAAYTKGDNLYGLFQNAAEIKRRKFAILVEGYLDLLTPFQHGIRNCVASLGTALTKNQSKLLNRFCKNAVVNYDGDKAGARASKRAIGMLLEKDFVVKVLYLPGGADPDEFIRSNGVEKFNELRGKSKSYYDFLIEQAPREYDVRNAKDKNAIFEEILPICSAIHDTVEKRQFFDDMMNALHIVDPEVKSVFEEAVKLRLKADKNIRNQPEVTELKQRAFVKPTVAEQELLELILPDAELRSLVLPTLEPPDYEHLASADVFRAVVELQRNGAEINAESLQSLVGESDLLSIILLSEHQRAADEAMDDYLSRAEKCVITLRTMAIERRLREIRDQVVVAERNGENELFNNLLLEQFELSRLRNELGGLND